MAQDGAILLIACSCGQKMKVPSQALGKTATCVKCGEKMKISVETTHPAEGSDPHPDDASQNTSSPSTQNRDEVVQLLLQHGLITEQHIEQALFLQKDVPKPLWLLLMEMGCISPENFHSLMTKQKGTASIDLMHYNIPTEMLHFIDKEIVHRNCIVPVDKLGKLLTVAMVCPLDFKTIQEVEEITGLKVKTMLSSYQDIDQTIKNQIRLDVPSFADIHTTQLAKELHTEFSNYNVITKALHCESLAPNTSIVQRLKSAQHETDRTTVDLMDIVANDPILTALTLRVANSNAYAFPNAVDTLGLAATLLGTEAMVKVAASIPAIDYTQQHSAIDYQGWMLQTQFCSQTANHISTATGIPAGRAAYCAALLHNLGQFIMLHLFPNSYAPLTQSLSGQQLIDREQCLYGISHPEFAYVIARKWNLPLGLSEAIRYQRDWQQATKARDAAAIVHLSLLVTDSYIEDKPLKLEDNNDLLTHLSISNEVIGDIYRKTIEQFSSAEAQVTPTPQNSPSVIS